MRNLNTWLQLRVGRTFELSTFESASNFTRLAHLRGYSFPRETKETGMRFGEVVRAPAVACNRESDERFLHSCVFTERYDVFAKFFERGFVFCPMTRIRDLTVQL